MLSKAAEYNKLKLNDLHTPRSADERPRVVDKKKVRTQRNAKDVSKSLPSPRTETDIDSPTQRRGPPWSTYSVNVRKYRTVPGLIYLRSREIEDSSGPWLHGINPVAGTQACGSGSCAPACVVYLPQEPSGANTLHVAD